MVDPAQCPSDAPRVLQLTLVGVRTKFQGLGLGSQTGQGLSLRSQQARQAVPGLGIMGGHKHPLAQLAGDFGV